MNLHNINNNFDSYQQLISLYQTNKDDMFSNIHIELKQWFSANMSAALGAVLDLLAESVNDISFDNISQDIEKILLKNDFLTYYGRKREIDINDTTIRFQKLKPTDGLFFKNYVVDELIGRRGFPNMSSALKEKMVEAIYEIFVNAQIHSNTKNIYTCGQFYPNKNKIEFTIVDTGIGFKDKINTKFGSTMNATQAIKWAIQDTNTTKSVTGGIGLSILREFIAKNKGKMQIVSDAGFYEFGEQGEDFKLFSDKFPGTIVNLQFCTDDPCNYSLKSEININDIF
ncbi:MAG: ATP-binding protein [Bacteroidales bacterium]|jgi:anti-sigma regulatory factor (Ser/Thr protein kinase)|nr:ATP-binding protein [Bacteroidales bacterium]